jgi:hypothetical protein
MRITSDEPGPGLSNCVVLVTWSGSTAKMGHWSEAGIAQSSLSCFPIVRSKIVLLNGKQIIISLMFRQAKWLSGQEQGSILEAVLTQAHIVCPAMGLQLTKWITCLCSFGNKLNHF